MIKIKIHTDFVLARFKVACSENAQISKINMNYLYNYWLVILTHLLEYLAITTIGRPRCILLDGAYSE